MLKSPIRQFASVVSIAGIFAVVVPALASAAVPFRGVANATVVGVEPCGEGDRLTVASTGQATHLGRFSRSESICLHSNGTFEGNLAFTAANGDKLYADVDGGFTSPTTADGTYSFTGGTGRFAGATGSARFTAVTSDGTHFVIRFDGTISY